MITRHDHHQEWQSNNDNRQAQGRRQQHQHHRRQHGAPRWIKLSFLSLILLTIVLHSRIYSSSTFKYLFLGIPNESSIISSSCSENRTSTTTTTATSKSARELSNPPQEPWDVITNEKKMNTAMASRSKTKLQDNQQQQTSVELSSSSFGPTKFFYSKFYQTTIIVTLSFGNATKTHLAERLLWSLAMNGQWRGHVAVLTDDSIHYHSMFSSIMVRTCRTNYCYYTFPYTNDNVNDGIKIHIMQAKDDDLYPIDTNTGKQLIFKKDAMRFKRFKTLLLYYLQETFTATTTTTASNKKQTNTFPSKTDDGDYGNNDDGDDILDNYSNAVQHVLYLDIDIVIARPIVNFLQDYQDFLIRKEILEWKQKQQSPQQSKKAQLTNNDATTAAQSNNKRMASQGTILLPNTNHTSSFMSMFSDCSTCARQNTNSGIILLHPQNSIDCLNEWKYYIDSGSEWGIYDQRFLRDIKQQNQNQQTNEQKQTKKQCSILHMKPLDHHRIYPTWKEMRTKLSTTFIHNTNSYNSLKIPYHVQTTYFDYILRQRHGRHDRHLPEGHEQQQNSMVGEEEDDDDQRRRKRQEEKQQLWWTKVQLAMSENF